nr:MAG TPA: hypothetical protein [Caudoviricetes sp.]
MLIVDAREYIIIIAMVEYHSLILLDRLQRITK